VAARKLHPAQAHEPPKFLQHLAIDDISNSSSKVIVKPEPTAVFELLLSHLIL